MKKQDRKTAKKNKRNNARRNALSGVLLVCRHIYKPDPGYAQKPPQWFIGRQVKITFKSHRPVPEENMWVLVRAVAEDGRLIGTLASHPVWLQHLQYGDPITVDRNKILAVELTREEWHQEMNQLKAEKDYTNPHFGPPQGPAFEKLFAVMIPPRVALKLWRDRPPGKEQASIWQ